MAIPVDYNAYLNIADAYIERANGQDCESSRKDDTEQACELYQLIGKYSTIGLRQNILNIWTKEKEKYNASKETIRTASRIIPFKYKTHGICYK